MLAVCAATALSACDAAPADTDTCDEAESYEYDDDCGYWEGSTGTAIWVWYPWVTPWSGGTPSPGTKPTPPPGTVTVAPPKTKPAPPPGKAKPAAPARPVNPANPAKPRK